MSIKNEIEGPSGYLRKVREAYMPDTKKMAELAYESYKIKHHGKVTEAFIRNDVDSALAEMFIAETEIFQQKNAEIMTRVLPYFHAELYNKTNSKYSETDEGISKLLELYKKTQESKCSEAEFINSISNVIVPIVDIVSFSQKQSAKCRVGETLQNHLSNIFDICHISYESQQQKVDGGTIMDFVIPNKKAIGMMPDQVMNIECQTTLKDRFRLTTGKSTDGKIKRYLATVTGAGLVTSRDTKDFTIEKVKEIIMDNNVTLVVLEPVKKEIIHRLQISLDLLSKGQHIREKNITLQDLTKLVSLSDKKIISFTELINRDIRSTLVYWE